MKTSIEANTSTAQPSPTLELPTPPRAIRDWMERLQNEGHSSHLVGECVLQLALGLAPTQFRARTSISREALLSLAPRAIPTGVLSGAITIPTAAGPLDLLPDSSEDSPPNDWTSSSFAILDLAFDPIGGKLTAQAQAVRDIAARTLNPGDRALLSNDPAFALEAARLVAIYGLSPSPSLLDRARKIHFEASPQMHSRMRRLLRETLLAPHARAGLELLRDSGAEAALVPGVDADAPARVGRVPAQLRVRLLAWLVDAEARSLLRTLRFGGQFSSDLYRLLEHHPIDTRVDAEHDGEVRKLLGRLSKSEIEDLLSVRHAESEALGESDQADRIAGDLEQLTRAFTRVREQQRRRERRAQLAISGAEIMQALGCEPGPIIGRAIRHLEQTVEADPEANTPERLLAEIDRWRDAQ